MDLHIKSTKRFYNRDLLNLVFANCFDHRFFPHTEYFITITFCDTLLVLETQLGTIILIEEIILTLSRLIFFSSEL